jgi:DNA-binding transcriptional ArsR family regulator
MEQVLQAIASGYRRRILQLVLGRELSAGEVASHFPYVTRPAISQHLSILRDARLLYERRRGTRRLYRARVEGLSELRGFLDPFWEELSRQREVDLAELRRGFEADERAAARKKKKRAEGKTRT